MVRCAVKYCEHTAANCFKRVGTFRKVDDDKNKNISFHRFPKDAARRKQWIELCHQTDIDADHAYVCSIHFDSNAYRNWWQKEQFPGLKVKLLLKSDARPNINLPSALLRSKMNQKNKEKTVESDENTEKVRENVDLNNSFQTVNSNEKQNNTNNDFDEIDEITDFEQLSDTDVDEITVKQANVTEKHSDKLDNNINCLKPVAEMDKKKSNETNKQNQSASFEPEKFVPINDYFNLADKLSQSEEQAAKFEKEVKSLRKKLQREQNSKILLLKKLDVRDRMITAKELQLENYMNRLKSIFTATQIKLILKPEQSKSHWQTEDIALGTSLHAISPRAYEFLRTKMNYPLPSFSTLRNWKHLKQPKPDDNPGLLLFEPDTSNE